MRTGSIEFRQAKHLLRRFIGDKSGATVVEYGLIAGIISIIIIAGLGVIGETMSDDIFGVVGRTLDAALAD